MLPVVRPRVFAEIDKQGSQGQGIRSLRRLPQQISGAYVEDYPGVSTPDLRQGRLLEPYERLTPGDRQHLHKIASDLNTLRRVEDAVRDGYVETQTYIPGFLADKDYIVNLQWFAFYAVRGYASQHHKPATLVDIYQRVAENVRSLQREGAWPRDWKYPSKRTIDRRVNEIASANPIENHIMDEAKPRVICTRAGEYLPNPALFEDIGKILEA